MALLIVNLDKQIGNAQAWRDSFADQIPDLEIRIWPDAGEVADIEYLAFIRPDFDVLPRLPNLKAMFSRSAGVHFSARGMHHGSRISRRKRRSSGMTILSARSATSSPTIHGSGAKLTRAGERLRRDLAASGASVCVLPGWLPVSP